MNTDEQITVLTAALRWADSHVCGHEDTHRGGAIWEICDQCGMKWADDEGGKPQFAYPAPLEALRGLLRTLTNQRLATEPAGAVSLWSYERVQPGSDGKSWVESYTRAKPSDEPGIRNVKRWDAAVSDANEEKLDAMRRTLEIIAVRDAPNAAQCAEDTLVNLGIWTAPTSGAPTLDRGAASASSCVKSPTYEELEEELQMTRNALKVAEVALRPLPATLGQYLSADPGTIESDGDFERAREKGYFRPCADICPTWYATHLRFEGWKAHADYFHPSAVGPKTPQEFGGWFAVNYPENSVISDSYWHAERIYDAAESAIKSFQGRKDAEAAAFHQEQMRQDRIGEAVAHHNLKWPVEHAGAIIFNGARITKEEFEARAELTVRAKYVKTLD